MLRGGDAIPLYSYPCPRCGLTTEGIRPMSAETNACPRCGAVVRRNGANRVAVAQPSVDTRGMFRRFTEATAEIDHGYAKVEADLERPVQAPNLWREAKAAHRAMVAAGEASGPSTPTERTTKPAGLLRSPAEE